MAVANSVTEVEGRRSARRTQQGRFPVVSLTLGVLSLIGMMVSLWMIFFYAPEDTLEGDAQRIFYFHVPIAWIGLLGFGVMTMGGIAYLWKRDERWDWLARASAEVGGVFLSIAVVLGSLWGKTTWGTWWSWDPKLTAVLILWFMYIAYLMLRSYMGRTDASARAAAVLAIVGVVDIPIIYEAANWWRSLHPAQQVGVAGALPTEAVITLMVSLVTFTLLYSFLMVQLYQLQKLQTLAQRLRAGIEDMAH